MFDRSDFMLYSMSQDRGLNCYEWSGKVVESCIQTIENLEHPIHPKNNGCSFEEYVALETILMTAQDFGMKDMQKICEGSRSRNFFYKNIEDLATKYPNTYLKFKPEAHKTLKWLMVDLARIPVWCEALGYLVDRGYDKKYQAR